MPQEKRPKTLLDQRRDVLHTHHYVIRTDEAYVDWARRVIRYALSPYLAHYHAERKHQGLDTALLVLEPDIGGQTGHVRRREHLGDLLS